jgi:hypothetical protein
MESLEPAVNRPTRKGSRRRAAAFGLIALPVAGSVLMAPAIACAAEPAIVRTAVTTGSGADQDLTDEDLVQTYIDSGYSFDDALVLSERWGIGDVYETKVKAGSYLMNGDTLADSPLADVAAADGYSSDELAALFRDSGYSYEDAQVLAQTWDVTADEAKVLAGIELKTVGALPLVDPATADVP